MKIIIFAAIILLTAAGCNSSSTNTDKPATASTKTAEIKKASFFPVTSFIKGQLRVIDSLPITPLHTITINNKTDSFWLKKDQLAPLLADFLSPEISDTNLINSFKETSFNDQTLNAITFTYDPSTILPDSFSLRHWDVYITPESGKVSKVYLVKQLTENGNSITRQLTWRSDKWALIVTLLNKPDGSSQLVKEDKFIWNFNE